MLTVEALPASLAPVDCCERLRGLPYLLFLDSAARGPAVGRYSFVTADPFAVVRSTGARTECVDMESGSVRRMDGDALDAVRALLAPHGIVPVPGLPPFLGGAAGYLGYEWAHVLERLPRARHDDLGLDDVVLGLYDWVLAWDHSAPAAWLISTGMPATSPSARARRAASRAAAVRQRLSGGERTAAGTWTPSGNGLRDTRANRGAARPAPSHSVDQGWWSERLSLRSTSSKRGYLAAIERLHEYINAGDLFQANLSQRFAAPLDEAPWTLYRRLRALGPAPFGAYFEVPHGAVLSASPERFLRLDHDRHVETRPIKGTRPRGRDPGHDAALGRALMASTKDRAENLMIVDVMRNDLSRVCVPRTVRAPDLFALERHAAVQHLVSTVVGTLQPDVDAADLLRAAFPGGSITGAPKLRAMEIIAELEPVARGVYCGAMGYWSATGALDTSIAIRTAVAVGEHVYFSAGGAVVSDSVGEQEYLETLDKARGLIDAIDARP